MLPQLLNMRGYYKLPEATEAAIDGDGWLHTGDLATVDGEGYFKITGRSKDMIIRGGENVYPREIEEFLYTNPKVADVQVVGVTDQRFGEEIMAWVLLRAGERATKEMHGAGRNLATRDGSSLRTVRAFIQPAVARPDAGCWDSMVFIRYVPIGLSGWTYNPGL